MDFSRLDRYREIVDDWPAFLDASQAPLPITLWVNTLRADVETVARRLDEVDGMGGEPLAWYERGLRLPFGSRPGKTLTYVTGLVHIQEEVSMLPVAFLDPRPGERVLDQCAAPGNKTVQAAVHMENTGTLVGNDINQHRLGMVVRNLERIGLTNTVLTNWNGANFSADVGTFDRVLADVPCSCEGTTRKNPEILWREPPRPMNFPGAQAAILRKAVQRCRPGGRIVYSTCTYDPDENEGVVDTILGEYPDAVRLAPARLDGLVGSPGLVEWQDRRFSPEMTRTLRVWPHQNDTGGFFVAVLERLGPSRKGTVEGGA